MSRMDREPGLPLDCPLTECIKGRERIDDTTVCATTDLYIGRWGDYLHGPYVLFAAANLIEELLEDGERIGHIESLKFKKIMTRQLKIFASIGAHPDGIWQDEEPPSVTARMTTDKGREIVICGYQTDEIVERVDESNEGNPFLDYCGKIKFSSRALGGGEVDISYCHMAMTDDLRRVFGQLSEISELGATMLILYDTIATISYWAIRHQGLSMGLRNFRVPPSNIVPEGMRVRINYNPKSDKITPKGWVIAATNVEFGELDSMEDLEFGGAYAHCYAKGQELFNDLFREAGVRSRARIFF